MKPTTEIPMDAETTEALTKHEVHLKVLTPKGVFEAIFKLKETIAHVIKNVVKEMDLRHKDETFELVKDGQVLQPDNNSLESFGLHGHEKLTLVAQGTGV
jgi:hypothetical protein